MKTDWKIWLSRICSGLITLAIVASAIMKIAHAPTMVEAMTKLGFSEGALAPLAMVELACLAIYHIPKTAILGAVLLTGYFGGAILAHVLGGESIAPVALIGLMVWGGIYFRNPGLQSLLPLRKA